VEDSLPDGITRHHPRAAYLPILEDDNKPVDKKGEKALYLVRV